MLQHPVLPRHMPSFFAAWTQIGRECRRRESMGQGRRCSTACLAWLLAISATTAAQPWDSNFSVHSVPLPRCGCAYLTARATHRLFHQFFPRQPTLTQSHFSLLGRCGAAGFHLAAGPPVSSQLPTGLPSRGLQALHSSQPHHRRLRHRDAVQHSLRVRSVHEGELPRKPPAGWSFSWLLDAALTSRIHKRLP